MHTPPTTDTTGADDRAAMPPKTPARHPRPPGGDPLRRVDTPVLSLTGMVLNNRAGVERITPKKKPDWLRARVPGGPGYTRLKGIMAEHRLHTVCEEASCPNMGECWGRGIATIMILGDTCTRACGFCNVKTGRPGVLDADEPRRVAESLALMGLKHVVITSVNRDELPDGGAAVWAETIVRAREACPGMAVEVLIPDFEGDGEALQKVIDARPHIIAHNLETVRRMYGAVRPSAKFDRSLELLRRVKEQGVVAKTGIMVGIGERDEEVVGLMGEVQRETRAGSSEPRTANGEPGGANRELGTANGESRAGGVIRGALPGSRFAAPGSPPSSCDILTIGQYLQPTRNHLPIDRWVTPERFAFFKEEGLRLGFKVVESGPLVRSSYHADQQADSLTGIADLRRTS